MTSLIAKLMGWIGLPQWALELIALGMVAFAVLYWRHSVYQDGIAAQKASDAAALTTLRDDTARENARLKDIADKAAHAHDQELADLRDFRDSHPLHGGLCLDAHSGGGHLPTAAQPDASHAGTGSAAGNIQPVPAPDTGPGGPRDPDVRHLLDVLAGRADVVSAQAREWQATLGENPVAKNQQ